MTFNTTYPKGAFELMQQGATYLDVRTEEEFNQGHPKGAVNIPAFLISPTGRMENPKFLEKVETTFPQKSTQLVLGCATGGRSAAACQWLSEAGYTDLTNCDGSWKGKPGVPGWEDEGLPRE